MKTIIGTLLVSMFLAGCGDDGVNGRNGINGLNGSSGEHGEQGLPGQNGEDGENGPSGADGGSCHVEQLDKKCARIFCDDGSEAFVGKCKDFTGEEDEEDSED